MRPGTCCARSAAQIPDGAILISGARGGIHAEAAVFAALTSGKLSGVGLDVWEQEPPETDHPLQGHPAVIATSHIAGVTSESRARVTQMATEAFAKAAAGRVPPRLLILEVRDVIAKRLSTRVRETS